MFPENFIAVGTQYYRSPTPEEKDWANDLRLIAESGFNVIKVLAQWRYAGRVEGAYDFADLLRLMDLAQENGLKVVVNVMPECPPAWFDKKHPTEFVVTADGRVMRPRTVACRQLGGAPGPCMNSPVAQEGRRAFIDALAKALTNHPAMFIWDAWNEPELSSGILREPNKEDLLCYCDHCRAKFQGWLERKYKTPQALEAAWHGCYERFDEVEPPRDVGVFKPMVDWRMFFVDVMAEELERRVAAIRAVDHTHPVMSHTVPIPYFNVITTASSDARLAAHCDMFGNSLGSRPFPMSAITTAAPGKVVINSEIHAVGGSTWSRPDPRELTYACMKQHLFGPLARGIQGFLFWQFRCEKLGFESPAWGLLAPDGSKTPYLGYAARAARALTDNASRITSLDVPKSRVAILASDMNQIFLWCLTENSDSCFRSVSGAFEALYAANLRVDVVSREQAVAGALSQYKAVFALLPYYMDEAYADALRAYVRFGGTLISEAFFGAQRDEDGYFGESVPGYGFDEVFGCREESTTGAAVFSDAYGKSWSSDDERRMYVRLSDGAMGWRFAERLAPTGGKPFLFFEDGGAAAVENEYGAGKAILIGTALGYGARQFPENAKLLVKLAREAGAEPVAKASAGVRVDTLEKGGQARGVLLINRAGGDVTAEVEIPNLVPGATYREIAGDGAFRADAGALRLPLPKDDAALYLIEE